ncbi:MAG: hypothetical protein JST21_00550 [Bacteroidetes bacterium]|nr:hypothetical protein [Bacteroidota bacterium]
MIYKTSLDNLAKGVTISVTVIFAAIIIGQFSLMKGIGQVIPICITIVLFLIYFMLFALRPIHYEVSTDMLIIHRLFPDVKIELSQIDKAQLIDKEKINWTFRIYGVGGIFGYFGKFSNSNFGNMTWYATRRDKTVLLQTFNNRKIILTPDEPEKFIANLKL